MNKTSKLLLGTTFLACINSAFAADDSARTNLINISGAIEAAIERAKVEFSAKAGATLSANIDLLTNTNNMYLNSLKINRQYNICLDFKGAAPTSTKTSQTVPVSTSLWGKKIVLVAVYDANDEQLSNFECVTDADTGVQHFVGQKDVAEGTKSFISQYESTSPYLGSCVYLLEATINQTGNNAPNSLWTTYAPA